LGALVGSMYLKKKLKTSLTANRKESATRGQEFGRPLIVKLNRNFQPATWDTGMRRKPRLSKKK